MGMTVRPENSSGVLPPVVKQPVVKRPVANPDVSTPRLQALTSFVDTAVPALLLLTLMAGEQSETGPDLKRLAGMLSQLQDGTAAGAGDGPDPTAIGRLYRAVVSLKAQATDQLTDH